jgi:integrase
MYQLYKRKGSEAWWVSWTIDGDRFRGSLRTNDEDAARLIAADKYRRALISPITGERETITLDGALGRYMMEHARFQSSAQTTRHQGKALLRILKKPTLLATIDDATVSRFKAQRRGEKARRGKSPKKGRGSAPMDRLISNATVNREMGLLRRVMNMADKDWGLAVGKVEWQRHMLEESDGNTRWLTLEQFNRVLAVSPSHMKGPLTAAICTGLRAQNVIQLDWAEVDMRARMITVKIKSRKPGGRVLAVPIAQPLFILLANLGPKDAGRVFLYRGRPIKTDTRHAFLTALANAGIAAKYTWHDLRHTAASWMRQRKVPIDIIQKILGHTDIKSTMRYAHIGEASHVEAVDAIGGMFDDTPVAQPDLVKAKKS